MIIINVYLNSTNVLSIDINILLFLHQTKNTEGEGVQINVQHTSSHRTRGNNPTVIQKKETVIDKYDDTKEPAKSGEEVENMAAVTDIRCLCLVCIQVGWWSLWFYRCNSCRW